MGCRVLKMTVSPTARSDVWSMDSVIGDFIWTAIDYLGDAYESLSSGHPDYMNGKHPYPTHISFCGDLDIVGHQKPQSVYRTVLWGASPAGMLVHRPVAVAERVSGWGWPEELESWSWAGASPGTQTQHTSPFVLCELVS